jgi:hypothetical protein
MPRVFPRSTPWGLIGMIGLVLLVEHSLADSGSPFRSTISLSWSIARGEAKGRAVKSEILCLGSSWTQSGIVSKVIARRTGLKTYNLAVSGGSSATSYYLLRQALEAGARPSAILVDFHPHLISAPVDEGSWGSLLGWTEFLDLARWSGDRRKTTSMTLAKLFPSIDSANQIRAAILSGLSGQVFPGKALNQALLRNLFRNEGSFIFPEVGTYHGEIGDLARANLLSDHWQCDPLKLEYMHRLLKLAADWKIQVYWMMPPLVPALHAEREARGLNAAYTEFARSFRSYPNLVLLDARYSEFGAKLFVDATHMNQRGAFFLSEMVANALRDRDPRETQILLGRRRETPIDVPMEDFGSSGIAINAADALRR